MKKDLRIIAEQFDCGLIYFFGSQAEEGRRYLAGEDVKPDLNSDLDVALALRNPPPLTISIYGEIYKEISEILEPFSIDLVFIHELDTLFQYEVIKGVRVYEKDERFADEFEEGVMKRAADLTFKKRMMDHEIMEAMKNGYFEFEYSANP
jgi:predicted nucleotidyltransferase